MWITETAREAGVNTQTLRYYERRGLLPKPPRRGSGYRDYSDDAVRIVRYFLGLPSFVQDTPPPVMMVALAQDTGRSASASQTSNPTVTGTVTDNSPTAVLRAGFEATPSASFADVLADLRPDGHFTLDRARLEPMHGSGLPDGSYTLHLLARTTPATSPPATSPCSSW